MITRCGALTAGTTGNAVAMDDTELLQSTSSTYIPPTLIRQGEAVEDVFQNIVVQPETFLPLSQQLSNILTYMSGWVAKKILETVTCVTCRASLVVTSPGPKYKNSFIFLQLKSNGGLLLPSDGVVSIITATERHLRQLSDVHTVSGKLKLIHIQSRVMAEVGHKDLLGLGNHIADTSVGIENHYFHLIKGIVRVFL